MSNICRRTRMPELPDLSAVPERTLRRALGHAMRTDTAGPLPRGVSRSGEDYLARLAMLGDPIRLGLYRDPAAAAKAVETAQERWRRHLEAEVQRRGGRRAPGGSSRLVKVPDWRGMADIYLLDAVRTLRDVQGSIRRYQDDARQTVTLRVGREEYYLGIAADREAANRLQAETAKQWNKAARAEMRRRLERYKAARAADTNIDPFEETP